MKWMRYVGKSRVLSVEVYLLTADLSLGDLVT